MAVFSYSSELEGKNVNIFSNSSELEEKNIHAYNESSATYVIDDDFGSITSSVDVDEDYGFITDDNILGQNYITYGSISINETLVPYGTIDIGDNDFAELKLVKVGIGDVTFTVLGEAFIFTTPIEKGSGFIRINGTSGDPRFTLAHVGTGSLFSFSSTTEAVGSNPPEFTQLFRISGQVIEISSKSYVGSGSLFTFVSATEASSSVEQAQGLFKIVGSAVLSASLSHVGSGSLFAFTGSSESTTADPPDTTLLVRFAGTADYQFFKNNTQTTEGSLILRGISESVFAHAFDATGIINVEGTKAESITPAPHIGSGTLFAITGSSEATTANPPEETALFRFSGQSTERSTDSEVGSGTLRVGESGAYTIFRLGHIGSVKIDIEGTAAESITPAPHIGSGSLFAITGSSEAVTVDLPESTILFKVGGSAIEKNTESYVGSVDLDINGSATTLFGLGHIGSGSLFTFVSATESIAVNPPEETALFRITGSAIEKNTESYRGSGSLFTFVSSTESSSSVEQSSGLFKISGRARDIFVINNIGSGSLFTFVSATESIAVNPPEDTILFRISGSAIEKNTESYRGAGSLFGFSSTTEAVGSNPPESTAVFRFTGTATESITPAPHVGKGSLFTFGSATETTAVSPETAGVFVFAGTAGQKRTKAFVGSGSLFGFSSTTESSAVTPPTFAPLFRVAGFSAESFVPAPHIGSGTLLTFSSATETRSVSPKASVLFEFIGNVTETSTRSQVGSGSLFAITGSYEAIEVIPKISGVLFTLFGSLRESYTPAPEIGNGLMNLEGLSANRKIIFVPAKPTRIIII
jgi:hypothetical protein